MKIPSDKKLRDEASELDFYDNPDRDAASAFIERLIQYINILREREEEPVS